MNSTWRELCIEAKEALASGKKNEARRLAHRAARLAPQQEEPWLLLGAIASPRASRAFLKQALTVNPSSARAIKGLRWAEERLKTEKLQNTSALPRPNGLAVLNLPHLGSAALIAVILFTTAFALLAWMRPPGVDDGLRLVSGAAARGLDQLLATSTYTATPTSSSTPTSMVTYTPTPTATSTKTSTPSPTPTATIGANAAGIEKLFIEMPEDLGEHERWIDIDLTHQILAAYEGGDLIKTFIVSTGRAGTPTVTGTYAIWVKVRIQRMSGPGYSIPNVPWVMYFYKSYGIHGTWWHNNFGTPMSAGCVNMTIEDAKWMYDWASVGTVVKVHY